MAAPRKPRRYEQWAGHPDGVPEAPTNCIAYVRHPDMYFSKQCFRRRGHGPHKLWCRQHGKEVSPDWRPELEED